MITALNVDKLRLDLGEYVLSVQALFARAGGRRVLNGIELDVKRGGCTALIGPAGAGKSLTLACIAGAVKPVRGRVRYFGYELRGRSEDRVAAMGIVRTHQQPRPFGDMTVLETVTVGALLRHRRLRRAQAHARELLALTGLGDRGDLRFTQLAPVDCKRLELARALATDPQLLLLDDLATDIDGGAFAELQALLSRVRERNISIVAAARTLDRCPIAVDDVVEIDGGKTLEVGAYAAADLRV